MLVGANGAGKTTLLEALAYLSGLRSFRGVPDAALVRMGADAAVVRGEFQRASGGYLVEVELPASGRRRVLVNSKRPARFREVAAAVPLVTFQPDDLDLVKRGPALRRDYLDDLAVQRWPVAAGEQQDYDRALRQRNALLRDQGRHADRAALDTWDERVAATGAAVVARRLLLLGELEPLTASAYAEIAPADDQALEWTYRHANVDAAGVGDRLAAAAWEERLHAGLAARRHVDIERKATTVGPHRDEPGFVLGGRDARYQASQGEQRSVALALRLSAFDALSAAHGAKPILALDDVFSELDARRAAGLQRRLPDAQVFVTTARPEEVPLEGRRWMVAEGAVA